MRLSTAGDNNATARTSPSKGHKISLVLASFAAVVTLGMMLHVSLNAASRSFMNNPLDGTLEYTQYWYLPIIAFIGIVTAQRHREHIEARLLFDHLPTRIQPIVQAATDLLTLIVAALITIYGAMMAFDSMAVGRTAGVTGVVVWPATFVVPTAMAIFTLWLAVDLIKTLRSHFSGAAATLTYEKGTQQ